MSTLRGQQFHNAFFWAINRSQDATIMHEWYSKVGQGVAGEYRYNFGAFSNGDLTSHLLEQHATELLQSDGSLRPVAATRTYDFRGGANQALPFGLRARANVNYFSSLTTNQTYNTNPLRRLAEQSQRRRESGGRLGHLQPERHASIAANISTGRRAPPSTAALPGLR